ncbi:hypothetical protein CEXT_193831 [Caerostris extrusa]|uniref:Uncharacterized protein n=1 Tax=Caerostris extrusa TaxID=172846 RepID=A0AAV4UIJ9_CAEEX|nr:hypothetical protein CEXT_193831 [Caerostris extrusa]
MEVDLDAYVTDEEIIAKRINQQEEKRMCHSGHIDMFYILQLPRHFITVSIPRFLASAETIFKTQNLALLETLKDFGIWYFFTQNYTFPKKLSIISPKYRCIDFKRPKTVNKSFPISEHRWLATWQIFFAAALFQGRKLADWKISAPDFRGCGGEVKQRKLGQSGVHGLEIVLAIKIILFPRKLSINTPNIDVSILKDQKVVNKSFPISEHCWLATCKAEFKPWGNSSRDKVCKAGALIWEVEGKRFWFCERQCQCLVPLLEWLRVEKFDLGGTSGGAQELKQRKLAAKREFTPWGNSSRDKVCKAGALIWEVEGKRFWLCEEQCQCQCLVPLLEWLRVEKFDLGSTSGGAQELKV